MKRFKNIIFAGTFDNLHIGHKKMFDKAFEIAEHVSIFITTKKLYQSKLLASLISTWQVRKRAVEQYLKNRNWLNRASFFKLDDVYGSSVKHDFFDAILVTEGTKQNAVEINIQRKEKGLKQFKIIVAPYVKGDDGEVVTSERIRSGEIDLEGHNYSLSVTRNSVIKRLILPDNLREDLRKPLGKVISGSVDQLSVTAKKLPQYINKLKSTMVIAVGDIVTMSLMQINLVPDLSIVDLRSRRQNLKDGSSEILSRLNSLSFRSPTYSKSQKHIFRFFLPQDQLKQKVSKNSNSPSLVYSNNKAGTIDLQTVNILRKSFRDFFSTGKKQVIVIEGEEDLLALPAILLAPLGSVVLYGQWNLGIVIVEITEQKKKAVEQILRRFS